MNTIGNIILRNEVKAYLEKAMIKNENFSIRSFAKKVGVDSGSLSRFLQGKRNLTNEVAFKIISKIDIGEDRKNKLSKIFLDENSDKKVELKDYSIRTFWYYHAIRTLLRCDFENKNLEFIQHKLGLSKKETEDAIEYLLTNKLISKKDDEYIVDDQFIMLTGHISDSTLRDYHNQMLNLALATLNDLDETRLSSFSSMVIPCDPNLFDEAENILVKAKEEIRLLLSGAEKKDVYSLNIQFVPLTKNLI